METRLSQHRTQEHQFEIFAMSLSHFSSFAHFTWVGRLFSVSA